jgi:hypothetical protein
MYNIPILKVIVILFGLIVSLFLAVISGFMMVFGKQYFVLLIFPLLGVLLYFLFKSSFSNKRLALNVTFIIGFLLMIIFEIGEVVKKNLLNELDLLYNETNQNTQLILLNEPNFFIPVVSLALFMIVVLTFHFSTSKE